MYTSKHFSVTKSDMDILDHFSSVSTPLFFEQFFESSEDAAACHHILRFLIRSFELKKIKTVQAELPL